jgi:L-amino acid N-acyltransferase YncA
LLLSYARDKLGVGKGSFVARIGAANARSIALFSSLGFKVVRTISVFDEVEMRVLDTDDVAQNWPAGEVRGYPEYIQDAIT